MGPIEEQFCRIYAGGVNYKQVLKLTKMMDNTSGIPVPEMDFRDTDDAYIFVWPRGTKCEIYVNYISLRHKGETKAHLYDQEFVNRLAYIFGESSLDKSIKSVPMARKIASEYITFPPGEGDEDQGTIRIYRKKLIDSISYKMMPNIGANEVFFNLIIGYQNGIYDCNLPQSALVDFLTALTGMKPELGEESPC